MCRPGPRLDEGCFFSLGQVKPPRIAEAAVQMECKLRSTYDVVNKCDTPFLP